MSEVFYESEDNRVDVSTRFIEGYLLGIPMAIAANLTIIPKVAADLALETSQNFSKQYLR